MKSMPVEHPSPTEATVKHLYAHAFRCGFAGCNQFLYRLDESSGERILNSRICHIHARREGGPRWNPSQSPAENRSKANLILMCLSHASAIDDQATAANYPPKMLFAWKKDQIDEFETLRQGWALDSRMAKEVIEKSQSSIVIQHSRIELGGGGGRSPGAGGGGGGAIGAPAGNGGTGGNIHVNVNGSRWTADEVREWIGTAIHRSNSLSFGDLPFGAGAGGAPGFNQRGGDGGGGGDRLIGMDELAELRARDWDEEAQVEIGAAGKPATLPGQHGDDGGDAKMTFRSRDGSVLRQLSVKGGRGARSTDSYLPNDIREVSASDIEGGFRITALMPVNACEIRDTISILGGAWTTLTLPTVPFDAAISVVCVARWLSLAGARGLYLSIHDPANLEVSCVALNIGVDIAPGGFGSWALPIGAKFDREGVWTINVYASDLILSTFSFTVKAASNGCDILTAANLPPV